METCTDFRPFVQVGAVTLIPAGHPVNLEISVSPFPGCRTVYFRDMLPGLWNSGVKGVTSVPAGDSLAVLVVEEPIPVLIVEFRVAGPERSCPYARDEPQIPDVIRQLFHPFGELFPVDFEIHVLESGNWEFV